MRRQTNSSGLDSARHRSADPSKTIEALRAERKFNSDHADHINNHRLEFLKFYIGVMLAIIGGSSFLSSMKSVPIFYHFYLDAMGALTVVVVLFGLLSILIICNYWAGRDYCRARNKFIERQLTELRPSFNGYFDIKKRDLARIPSIKSMFFFVLALILVSNCTVVLLLVPMSFVLRDYTATIISTFFSLQLVMWLSYRYIFL